MSTSWMRSMVALDVVLSLVPAAVLAQESPGQVARALSPSSRVRCLDSVSRALLAEALARSSTVAAMVEAIQNTDLIVGIQSNPTQKRTLGEVRMVASTPEIRHVRVSLRVPNDRMTLIEVLGHELQHVMELAAATDCRDVERQGQLFARIGWKRPGNGLFETDAALEVGRRVAAEVRVSAAGR